MAKARATSPAPCGPSSSRPSSSMNRAPCLPSSPGWNMSRVRPRSSARRSTSSRAAPRSMATWVSWPQACMTPSISEANSRPVSSPRGRASMSARSSVVGPGWSPSMTATTEVVVPPSLGSRPSARSSSATTACVSGSCSPISGRRWRRRRTAITSGSAASAAARSGAASKSVMPASVAAPRWSCRGCRRQSHDSHCQGPSTVTCDPSSAVRVARMDPLRAPASTVT